MYFFYFWIVVWVILYAHDVCWLNNVWLVTCSSPKPAKLNRLHLQVPCWLEHKHTHKTTVTKTYWHKHTHTHTSSTHKHTLVKNYEECWYAWVDKDKCCMLAWSHTDPHMPTCRHKNTHTHTHVHRWENKEKLWHGWLHKVKLCMWVCKPHTHMLKYADTHTN